MKKTDYKKPTCKIVLLRHRMQLLAGSSTPPNDISDYDDWLQ